MKRVFKPLAISVIAAAAVVGAAHPASAATSDCLAGNLCVWKDSNFSNSRYQFGGDNAHWGAYAIADNDSSWYNKKAGSTRVQVYQDGDYHNTTICVGAGVAISSNSFANDKGSSNKWGGC